MASGESPAFAYALRPYSVPAPIPASPDRLAASVDAYEQADALAVEGISAESYAAAVKMPTKPIRQEGDPLQAMM